MLNRMKEKEGEKGRKEGGGGVCSTWSRGKEIGRKGGKRHREMRVMRNRGRAIQKV